MCRSRFSATTGSSSVSTAAYGDVWGMGTSGGSGTTYACVTYAAVTDRPLSTVGAPVRCVSPLSRPPGNLEFPCSQGPGRRSVRSWPDDQATPSGGGCVSATPNAPPAGGATVSAPPRGRRRAERSFGSALGWTVVGAVVPGTAFLAAGRRILGAITLALFLLLVGGGVWLATGGRHTAVRLAVDTWALLWVSVGIGLVALLLVLGVAAPAVAAGRLAATQSDLIAGVFSDDGKSATVDVAANPFGSQ